MVSKSRTRDRTPFDNNTYRQCEALKPWAEKKGIEIEFIEPHTPAQNGVAERLNRLLLEIARAILISAKVPKRYWPWAIKMANHIRNRTIMVKDSGGRTLPSRKYSANPFIKKAVLLVMEKLREVATLIQ
jgi:hypothetical protein